MQMHPDVPVVTDLADMWKVSCSPAMLSSVQLSCSYARLHVIEMYLFLQLPVTLDSGVIWQDSGRLKAFRVS